MKAKKGNSERNLTYIKADVQFFLGWILKIIPAYESQTNPDWSVVCVGSRQIRIKP